MEIKQVVVENEEYLCEMDISVEEWKEILQDETLLNANYKDALIKFYSEPEHKATCKALGEKFGVSPNSFNATITNFAKAVQKKLNRFEVLGTDGKPTYWAIPMLGKHVGEHFEWQIRPELAQAIEEMNIKGKHLLQKIYDEALEKHHWVFYRWFPGYEKYVKEYKKQAIEENWEDKVVRRLVKDTRENGISDLRQGNFTWDEYNQIKSHWTEIQPKIKNIAVNNSIDYQSYKDIINFFRKHTKGKRPAASNRVIAAFLPNFVTTVVNYEYLKYTIKELQKRLNDYPSLQDNWLKDNVIFINYCNSNVTFENPWHSSVFAWYLKEYFEQAAELKKENNQIMDQYLKLLRNNKNLILTGAPGTGKTYLAKQVALKMLFGKYSEEHLTSEELKLFNKHYCFVQFHPSYDYTDFVEGLRAEDLNGQVIFNLHNGIFKTFCKNAIEKAEEDNFEDLYNQFVDDLSESNIEFETPTHKKKFKVEINSNKSCVAIPLTEIGTRMSLTKEMIRNYVINGKIRDWKPYTTAVGNYFKEKYPVNTVAKDKANLPYIFVIDEINRGEISKIFGELFYSIDPGYRGKNGKVKTQYENIQAGDTVFDQEIGKGWFYVPENVYIIGTMNDIDRSVESMDFAMRRRFAWKEINAEERVSMWDGRIDDYKDEALKRMNALNSAIESIQGLSSAYHIGPAYFLKLETYKGDFEQLWENHLEGLLFEYLRGFPDAKSNLDEIKTAYENIVE